MDDLSIQFARIALSTIQNTSNLEESFYAGVLDWCMTLTSADEGGILSTADNAESLRVEYWRGTGLDLKSHILPVGRPPSSICARCIEYRKPQSISDVRNDNAFLALSDSPIHSELAIPVIHDDTVLGVINLESTVPGHFTSDHALTLQTFSALIGSFWRLVRTATRDSRRKDLLDSLSSLSQSLLRDARDTTLEMILNEALRLTHSDLGGVCLLAPKGDVLIVTPAKGLRPGVLQPRIPKGRGFTWLSLETGKPQNVANVLDHASIYHDLSAGEIKSLLCVPMFDGSRPLGVINIESKELNHFSLHDQDVLAAFAWEAAIAIRILGLAKRFRSADALAAIGSMSGNLTHRLNNSVGAIRVLSRMLTGKLTAAGTLDAAGIAQEIHDAATDTLGVVSHYEDVFSSPSGPVNVADAINQVVAELSPPSGITVDLVLASGTSTLDCGERLFAEVIRELLRNSLKSLGQAGHIRIIAESTGPCLVVRVWDDGPHIPADRVSHIFERRSTVRASGVGTGFGLWWIRTFLDKLGGTINYLDDDAVGNTFELLFPRDDALTHTGGQS